jgi:hypothetical protein
VHGASLVREIRIHVGDELPECQETIRNEGNRLISNVSQVNHELPVSKVALTPGAKQEVDWFAETPIPGDEHREPCTRNPEMLTIEYHDSIAPMEQSLRSYYEW